MNLNNIFIIAGIMITILILLSGIMTLVNNSRVRKILLFLKDEKYLTFYGKKCYYSATGLKKNYPSYPAKMEIYLTDNDVIFIGKHSFPFIFKTIEIPFILSKDPIKTQSKLKISRIFKPTKFNATEKQLNFEFVDSISYATNIFYHVDLVSSKDWEKLNIASNWQ